MKVNKLFILLLAIYLMVGCGSDKKERLQQLELLEQMNRADSVMKNDSLAEDLVDYFDKHGSDNEKMRARYILGRTYYNLGELVRQGELDYMSSGIYIEFDDKGNVACEYGVGSENYKKEVYEVKIENDWSSVEKKASGHIAFPLCGEGRFKCSVEGNQLILLPDEGAYYIMDPTKYFVKVE